jgi:flagellar hook-basal body complex protein FliE
MNIRKIIKEELLKEIVSGYDDPTVMGQHAVQTLSIIVNSYKDLSNVFGALANAIKDKQPKEDIITYLNETIEEMRQFIQSVEIVIKDFSERGLINKTNKIMDKMKSREVEIRTLINMPNDAITDTQFMERLKIILMDLLPSIQDWAKELNLTRGLFVDRLSGTNKGSFGMGFN